MKKEQDEEFDDLFRKGMQDPVNEASYREADWDAMEQMLAKGKKRPVIVYWLPVIGSAAAILLLFLGWLFLRPEVVKRQQQGQIAAAQHTAPATKGGQQEKGNTGKSGGPTRQPENNSAQKILSPANYAKTPDLKRNGKNSNSFLPLSADGVRRDTTGYGSIAQNDRPEALTLTANYVGISGDGSLLNDQSVVAGYQLKSGSAVSADAKTIDNRLKISGIKQAKLGYRPQLAMGVIASSDMNGVGSFQQSKVGGNFGLSFSVGLSKKWSISTGAVYSIKPYLTNFEDYHTSYQFKTDPVNINVNCRMIDIPLNVNYQIYNRQQNKISIGTGLSSYIILREDYSFNYANQYTYGPAGYSVINKDRNILSIVNLDATYQHQVNSKVGIVIQPYLKLPLSNVGAGQARLQTAGVAVGLNWNLNSSFKPK
jgi:hypothetical protein